MSEPIDSKQLRAFVSLVRTGSFTETARELNLTQPAISYAIRSLEENVGCTLLDRMGKTVVPTQAGEQLLVRAEIILKQMQESRSELQSLGRFGTTRLRIGASSTACQFVLPEVLREFKESFPECKIAVHPGDTTEGVDALREHQIDLAVCLQPEGNAPVEFQPLFTDELFFILSPEHPWAKEGKVVRSEMAAQTYILYEKTSYTFKIIEEYFREEKMSLDNVLELGNMEAIKEMVRKGLGIAIMARWSAQRELAEGSLVALPMGRKKLKRKWGILNWRGRRLSIAEEKFVGLCKSVCDRLGIE